MGGCGPSIKIDPAVFPASRILVAEQGERCSIAEQLRNLVCTFVLGENVLAGATTKPVQKLIQKRIIQGSGDRIGRKTKQTQHVTRHLEVSKMTRHQNCRAIV